MFLITNGSSVVALAADDKQVREYLVSRKVAAEKQSMSYLNSTYYKNMYPTVEAFVAAQMKGLYVLEVDFTGKLEVNDYQTIRALTANNNVTEKFFIIGKEETKIGEHITAKVVKKSLKSFGKTVVVNDQIKRDSNVVAPSPAKFKEMYDQLARINCLVEGWGNITVAPDSLDQYKMTPKMKETFTIKFVE